jgi:hypothetical protein
VARRPKSFPLMINPRQTLRQQLVQQPLGGYLNAIRVRPIFTLSLTEVSLAPMRNTCAWRHTRREKSGAKGANTRMIASGRGSMACPPSIG